MLQWPTCPPHMSDSAGAPAQCLADDLQGHGDPLQATAGHCTTGQALVCTAALHGPDLDTAALMHFTGSTPISRFAMICATLVERICHGTCQDQSQSTRQL